VRPRIGLLFAVAASGMTLLRRTKDMPRWRGADDFRIICDCQRHRRRANWKRVASRAVLACLPLVFTAFQFPALDVMSGKLDKLRRVGVVSAKVPAAQPATVMPIFTTQKVRDEFLDPRPQRLTLEIVKEQFFTTHVPYGSIIYREARRNRLAPELVAAIVQTESDFRVGLISHKKAQGLMQIVPETAELLGVKDPFDPHQNIAAGTRYLRYLMDRFPNERLALAAYNAGETKVARNGIPQYAETIQYIERVNKRRSRYQQRIRQSYASASKMREAF
jgi:Transglycosylase SLT domain